MKCFSFGAQDLCLCSITYACSDMVALHTCLTSSNRDAGNDLFNWLAIGTWILTSNFISTTLTTTPVDATNFCWNAFCLGAECFVPALCKFFNLIATCAVFCTRFVHPLIIGVTTYGHRVGALLLSLGSLPFGGTTFKLLVFRFQLSSFFFLLSVSMCWLHYLRPCLALFLLIFFCGDSCLQGPWSISWNHWGVSCRVSNAGQCSTLNVHRCFSLASGSFA